MMPPKETPRPNRSKTKPEVPAPPAKVPVLPTATEHPWGLRWDIAWLFVPVILLAFYWGKMMTGLLEPSNRPDSGAALVSLGLSAAVWLALLLGIMLLIPFLVRHRWLYPTIAVAGFGQLTWHFPIGWGTTLAICAMCVGTWASAEGIRRESESRRRLDVRSQLAHVMTWAVLGVSVGVALLQYDVSQRNLRPDQEAEHLAQQIARAIEPLGPKVFPGFSPTQTIDEFAGTRIPTADELFADIVQNNKYDAHNRGQLADRFSQLGLPESALPAAGVDVSEAKKRVDRILNESRQSAIKSIRDGLSEQLGVNFTGRETVHVALVRVIEQRLLAKSENFIRFLPPIISIGLFLALRIISPLLEILAVGCGWFWYRILRLSHVVRIRTFPTMAESLEWRKD